MAYCRKKTRRMTRFTINYILALCEKLTRDIIDYDNGKRNKSNADRGRNTFTKLMAIYNILIFEGYSKKYLDNFFFFKEEDNKHKKWTREACKFYHTWFIGREDDLSKADKFFYNDPRGIKIREEIDRLNQ